MSAKSDALSVFMSEKKSTHLPAVVAEAFDAAWDASAVCILAAAQNEAPPPTGIGKQRKDLTQDQYNHLGRILQGWGYDTYDIANAVAAIKYSLGVT